MNIALKEDAEVLDEVVVVGYGVQKKSDVTGAMIRVNSEDLTSRPVANAFEAMQGKAAGVDITSNERPGEIGTINIRGVRSLSASNTPLYVVDGIPLMSNSGIETLNPQDIESIDVLKMHLLLLFTVHAVLMVLFWLLLNKVRKVKCR